MGELWLPTGKLRWNHTVRQCLLASGFLTVPQLHSALLPKVPCSISKILKKIFLGSMFKIAQVFALIMSASLLFPACCINLRDMVSFASDNWMRRGLSWRIILCYSSWNARLNGRAVGVVYWFVIAGILDFIISSGIKLYVSNKCFCAKSHICLFPHLIYR